MLKLKNILLNFRVVFFVLLIVGCGSDGPESSPELESFTVSLSTSTNSAMEPGTNGHFTLSLNKAMNKAVSIDFTIGGTATNGTDYETILNSAIISANKVTVKIPVIVLSDSEMEDLETVIITLTTINNDNVKVSSSNAATLNIADKLESSSFLPSEAASFMVNPNATTETIALFYNLKTLSETSIVVGQQDAFSQFYQGQDGDSDVKKTTGSDPGLQGLDFVFMTDDQYNRDPSNWFFQQEQLVLQNAIEAYDKGMINTFSWHLRDPYNGKYFFAEFMTQFQRENALKSILPEGENHNYYKAKLDKVAQVANNLIGTDGNLVPIIFRPFHEFDGSWFWWGASYCTPQEYRELWQFTVEYLKDTKGVNNILFAFAPNDSYTTKTGYLSRYPGDNYVDIFGMDNYNDFNNQGQTGVDRANNKLKIISDLAKERTKIAALTETGYFVTPGSNSHIPNLFTENFYHAMTNDDVELGFMMFWNNTAGTYCTPPPSEANAAQDFNEFTSEPGILLQDKLPDLYTLPHD
ncbi:MAG: beta-mannosidase [Bacteroidetes bacterium]|nr:MAG: beta-mannosidase [Bacteroidota bacterium]